jgi:hypothetical protein
MIMPPTFAGEVAMPYADAKKQRGYLTEYARGWYWRNHDRELARQKAWRQANKTKVAEIQKRYRSKPEVKAQMAEAMRRRRAADPARNLAIWRKSHYKTSYGITVADFDRMLAAQGGRCAVCGSDKPGGRWARFAVDHCHKTGKVRGLLCTHCNVLVGRHESWYLPNKAKIDSYLANAK